MAAAALEWQSPATASLAGSETTGGESSTSISPHYRILVVHQSMVLDALIDACTNVWSAMFLLLCCSSVKAAVD